MSEKKMILIGVLAIIFVVFLVIVNLLDNKSLNGIKRKPVGHGQHGTARWASKSEIKKTFVFLPFEPEKWRKGVDLPTVQGTVVGCRGSGKKTFALVDEGDVHTLMIGAAGVGKTAFFLYPNLEFACASGMSFLQTDTKGDVVRNYGTIAKNIMDTTFLCLICVIRQGAMKTIYCILSINTWTFICQTRAIFQRKQRLKSTQKSQPRP